MEGKVSLITGGASGIVEATVELFAVVSRPEREVGDVVDAALCHAVLASAGTRNLVLDGPPL